MVEGCVEWRNLFLVVRSRTGDYSQRGRDQEPSIKPKVTSPWLTQTHLEVFHLPLTDPKQIISNLHSKHHKCHIQPGMNDRISALSFKQKLEQIQAFPNGGAIIHMSLFSWILLSESLDWACAWGCVYTDELQDRTIMSALVRSGLALPTCITQNAETHQLLGRRGGSRTWFLTSLVSCKV